MLCVLRTPEWLALKQEENMCEIINLAEYRAKSRRTVMVHGQELAWPDGWVLQVDTSNRISPEHFKLLIDELAEVCDDSF